MRVIAVAVVCAALIFGSIVYQRRSHALPDAWHEGAGGYEAATRMARENGAPLLVYFHTQWCGYCKRMERELFPKVEKQLREVVKVSLDPERSPGEQQLAARYGVHGYPSLFVERGGPPERVVAFRQVGGVWNQVSPDEFAGQLR